MKRLISDIPQQPLLSELKQHAFKKSHQAALNYVPFASRPQPVQLGGASAWANALRDKEYFAEASSVRMPFQSEMDDAPKNRLRTLSSFRTEDSYFFNNFTRKVAEEMLEDNEDKYA